MKRIAAAIAFALALFAPNAHAQTIVNCTVSCQLMTDSTVQTPMPTQCKLFNGAALVQLTGVSAVPANPVSGSPAGTGCVFNGVKFAEGTTVSLTAKFVIAGTDTDASTCSGAYQCPLVFTSSAGSTGDTTPPTAPSGLIAAAMSSATASISWNAATDNVGVTGYRLERCAGVGCTTFAQIAAPAGNAYADSGLTPSTAYSYRARAFDAAGNVGPYSNVGSMTTPAAPAANIIGETTILGQPDGGNGGWLIAQNATLTKAASIMSMSIYCSTPGGQVRLGIYDATGPGGIAGVKRAETNAFTPVAGWNTIPTTTSVSLPAGSYWLVFLPSVDAFQTPKGPNAGGVPNSVYLSTVPFAALPTPFPTSGPGWANDSMVHWSVYATFTAGLPPMNLRVGP